MRRVNLLKAHGGPHSTQHRLGCRCTSCRSAFNATSRMYARGLRKRDVKVNVSCSNPSCDQMLTITRRDYESRPHHYCSRQCSWAGRGVFYSGANHKDFKGGRAYSQYGYVTLLTTAIEDPFDLELAGSMTAHNGRVFEHRLVMARHLGRPLSSDEFVHHKNGVKDDNRLENLQVVDKSGHIRDHWHNQTAGQRIGELEREVARLRSLLGEDANGLG